ncbi:rhodanese-like domain-containing protein [Clostridium sp. Ade.TY]|uniref:rhodanese-like domain-containing protein n=1 Tax=Clostridium sp. Ade.TY TaxID=1391647 RepID=UPI00041239A5|nr:rhodanese-like domain-containing protein [Clostridium sp. Ade.TY]
MFSVFNKNYKSVNVNELENKLKSIDLIDIREPYEYKSGHLPNAKNIPMENIISNPDKYLNKDKEYYIICQSGARSSRACSALDKEGYKIINVSGGTGSYNGNLEK